MINQSARNVRGSDPVRQHLDNVLRRISGGVHCCSFTEVLVVADGRCALRLLPQDCLDVGNT